MQVLTWHRLLCVGLIPTCSLQEQTGKPYPRLHTQFESPVVCCGVVTLLRPVRIVQTSNDAERIRAAGAPAIQINTGKGCHLDAHMVGHGLDQLKLEQNGLLFIENVGNLVCPAAFDLGEAHKVVVLSVTEGEDKPLKYPEMFAASDLLLLNKADLLPHLDFNVGLCLANALKINPDLQTLIVSAKSGEGMPAFYAWVEGRAARHARAASNLVTAKQDR